MHEFSAADTLPKNGIAARFNRLIKDRMHAMLADCNLSNCYWPYALTYRVLHKNTHDGIWGSLPAHIVVGFSKHIPRQPIEYRCMCSQFGDQHHGGVTVMRH